MGLTPSRPKPPEEIDAEWALPGVRDDVPRRARRVLGLEKEKPMNTNRNQVIFGTAGSLLVVATLVGGGVVAAGNSG